MNENIDLKDDPNATVMEAGKVYELSENGGREVERPAGFDEPKELEPCSASKHS